MSRTDKDAPYKVRKERLGIKERGHNCVICAEGSQRTVVTGFTAIFYAHELRETEAFVAYAEEQGYTAKLTEVRGYLGETPDELAMSYRRTSRKSDFDEFFNKKRAIYSAPRGVRSSLLWDLYGKFNLEAALEQKISKFKLFGFDLSELAVEYAKHVSSKENIFTVVRVSKEVTAKRFHYHPHDDAGPSYLLYGHCHCSWCEPDEKGAKARLRAVTTELRKTFNSGDEEALEDLAQELIRSSSNAYRDTMAC